MRNLVDSDGWLEHFTAGKNAAFFAMPLEDADNLIVPTVSVLEVMKHIIRLRGERIAAEAVTAMQRGRVVELDIITAVNAANISVKHQLPLADAVIYATARQYEAVIWTQDAHFKRLDGVRYIEKQ